MPLLREYRCETSVTGHTTWNFVRDYDLKYIVKHGTYPKSALPFPTSLPEPDFVEKSLRRFAFLCSLSGSDLFYSRSISSAGIGGVIRESPNDLTLGRGIHSQV